MADCGMIDLAADALVKAIGYGEQVRGRFDAIAVVRVVIAALREPTEAMLVFDEPWDGMMTRAELAALWRAQIGIILNAREEPHEN